MLFIMIFLFLIFFCIDLICVLNAARITKEEELKGFLKDESDY